jgi:hemerythrin-like metal-binding protein
MTTRIAGPILGAAELDAPHADLLRRAEELAAAAAARDEARALGVALDLLQATAIHFAHEDELMERSAYPDRAPHRSAHDLFLQDLHLMTEEIEDAGVTPRVADWATGRLPQWFRYHIEKNDRPLARHLERVERRSGPASRVHRS